MQLNNKVKLALLILAIVILVIAYKGIKELLYKPEPGMAVLYLAPTTECRLPTTGCSAGDKRLAITLRMPNGAIYLRPFPVELNVEGNEQLGLNRVELGLTMQGMEMGVNRFSMQPVPARPGVWNGSVTLPICSSGRTDWRVEVKVFSEERSYQVQFPLTVSKS